MSTRALVTDRTTGSAVRSIDLSVASRIDVAGAEPWLLAPVILVVSYLLARLVQWWGTRRLTAVPTSPAGEDVAGEKDGEPSRTSFGLAVLEETYRPLALTIGLVGIYTSFDVLVGVDGSAVVVPTVTTVLIIAWMVAAVRVGNRWIEHVKASDTDYEFAPVFKNVWTVTVVLGGALLLLSIWNIEITPFLASAGILGIVLGFAAQDGISNLIGGVALYFDNTYKMGDVILVEDGMRGTVTDIGVRSTTVLTTDNRLVSVPNSVLNSTQVVNETAPQRHVRIEIPVTVAYGTDYREVERILLDVCEETSLIRESPSPRILFADFGDSALAFVARVFITHPLVEKRARDQFNRRVADAFDEAEITIPFPQRTISYLEEPDEVRFDELGEARSGPTSPDDPPAE